MGLIPFKYPGSATQYRKVHIKDWKAIEYPFEKRLDSNRSNNLCCGYCVDLSRWMLSSCPIFMMSLHEKTPQMGSERLVLLMRVMCHTFWLCNF